MNGSRQILVFVDDVNVIGRGFEYLRNVGCNRFSGKESGSTSEWEKDARNK